MAHIRKGDVSFWLSKDLKREDGPPYKAWQIAYPVPGDSPWTAGLIKTGWTTEPGVAEYCINELGWEVEGVMTFWQSYELSDWKQERVLLFNAETRAKPGYTPVNEFLTCWVDPDKWLLYKCGNGRDGFGAGCTVQFGRKLLFL
jgi:hypothetical protein